MHASRPLKALNWATDAKCVSYYDGPIEFVGRLWVPLRLAVLLNEDTWGLVALCRGAAVNGENALPSLNVYYQSPVLGNIVRL